MADSRLRVVCGGQWTADGRWVVIGPWLGRAQAIVYDPGNGDAWLDIWDCKAWVNQRRAAR